tara:strand:+ start:2656 stop:3531 length:876 start_codon:yes stop_codon:yes gene_type:complete
MKKLSLLAFVLLVSGLTLSCSGSVNLLETFATKDSDEAKYVQAKLLIDDGSYDSAVTVLLTTSTEFQAKAKYKTLLASAYAGKGGLTFLGLVESIKNASSTRVFPFLLSAFRSGTATTFASNIENLVLADEALASISSDPASRTEDENTLMILINFAIIGNYLSYYTDTAQDGTLDAGFTDVCTAADTPGTNINDTSVGAIGIALFKVLNIIPELENNFIANVIGSFTSCTAVEDIGSSLPGTPLSGMCSVTDATAFSALQYKGIRSLIKEDSVLGLGVNCTGDITACNCP